MMNEIDHDLNPFHARVLRFIDRGGLALTEMEGDPFSLLISIGSDDKIIENQRAIVFELGEDIIDPETGNSLGRFEIIKGEGKVTSLQSRMSVIKSERTVMELKENNLNALMIAAGQPRQEYRRVSAPFYRPKIGDYVRLI